MKSAVVAVRLKETGAPRTTLRLESSAEIVVEEKGNNARRTIEEAGDGPEVEKLVRGFTAMGRK